MCERVAEFKGKTIVHTIETFSTLITSPKFSMDDHAAEKSIRNSHSTNLQRPITLIASNANALSTFETKRTNRGLKNENKILKIRRRRRQYEAFSKGHRVDIYSLPRFRLCVHEYRNLRWWQQQQLAREPISKCKAIIPKWKLFVVSKRLCGLIVRL